MPIRNAERVVQKATAWRRTYALVGIIAALAASRALAQGPGMGPPPPPEVNVVAVQPQVVPVSMEFVGVTAASKVVEIRARVSGFLESRDFEEGAIVQEGEQLFSIDARPFEADRQIAQARVDQAKTGLRLAEQEVKRLKSVNVPGAIAQADLDRQLADQAEASASVRLAEAELAKTNLQLDYTKVQAPITGYIGKAQKEIGSVVDPNANSLLAVMQQVDPIYVSFSVSEREYLEWRTGEQSGVIKLEGDAPYLEITLLNGDVYAHRGALDFEGVALDTQTGTVELRATFDNPDGTLKAGQFVTAHVRGYSMPQAIAVPQRAVSQSPQGTYVYVVGAENKAEMRMIQPGNWSGKDWIVKAGLKPGDVIVVEGLTKVQPGIVVSPVPLVEQSPVAKAE